MRNITNTIQLLGIVSNMSESAITGAGKKKIVFTIKTYDVFRDSQGLKHKDWQKHQVIAWGSLADLVEKLGKEGQSIIVKGMLVYNDPAIVDKGKPFTNAIVMNEFLILRQAGE